MRSIANSKQYHTAVKRPAAERHVKIFGDRLRGCYLAPGGLNSDYDLKA